MKRSAWCRRPVRGVAVLAVLLSPPALSGQTTPWYGVRPGPELDDRVRAMVEGPDGRLWLGVESGLRVYDGYDLETFRAAPGSVDGFPPAPVESLFLDREGRLWVGQRDALVQIDPRRRTVEAVYLPDPVDPGRLPPGSVSHMIQDADGRLWVGTLDWSDRQESGLVLLDPETGAMERFHHDPADPTSLSNNRVRSMVVDAQGDLWVATWSGLNRRRRGESTFVRYRHDPEDPASLGYDDVMALHVGAEGTLWVATIGGGLARYDPVRDAFERVPGFPSERLTTLSGQHPGALWVGALDGGLARLDPASREVRTLDLRVRGLNWPRINATLFTSDGVLWIAATRSPGEDPGILARFDPETPEVAIRPTAGRVRAIHGGGPRDVWYGDGSELVRWDPVDGTEDRWSCPGLSPPGPLRWLSSLVRSPDGTLWVGYWGDPRRGLCRILPGADDPRPEPVELPEAAAGISVWDMAWADDRLWLATAGGLRSFDPESGRLERVDTGEDPRWAGPGSVVSVESDAESRLWVVRQDGQVLRRAPDGRLEAVARVFGDGLGGPGRAGPLRFGPGGGPWIGTEGRGLCAVDLAGGRCGRWLDASAGLPTDYVEDIVVDGRGHVWVTTFTGLTEIAPDSGIVRSMPAPGVVDLGAFQTGGAWSSPDGGTVALGLEQGLLLFRPAESRGNLRPPRVRIDRVESVGAGSLDLTAGPAILDSNQGDLVFDYVAIHFTEPTSNTYAYRLDGQDPEWRSVGTERRARYTNVGPGEYRFRVKAASANGVWSDEAAFSFRILAPWWRRPWALALWSTLAAAALLTLQAARLRRRRMVAILEQRQAEARRLQDLADTRSRLFANLSHEYRTPLALIQGQIEAARREPDGTGDDRLEMAERQTRTLQRLTDELLDLSKFEAGALVLDLRMGDLAELAHRAAADFGAAAASAGVDLRVEAEPGSILARFDPERMRRILSNLLSNALKYTPAGGEVVVRLEEDRRREEGPNILLSVEDTGTGIPEPARAHVFDRFYRGAPSPAGGIGTGIGLALVRELVELHGGTIDVDLDRPRGTCFVLRLPAGTTDVAGDPDASRMGRPDDDDPSDTGADERPIILVVEDHEDTRTFLRQELESDYRVDVAPDGEKGLSRAIELLPDLVLTDVGLPGMDGYELARRLRDDERTSHVPIVMLTGHVSDDARVEGLESGVDDYLGKPFSARVLRSRVQNLLELRRLLRTRYAGELWLRPEEVEGTSLDRQFLAAVAKVIEDRIADPDFSVEELASAVAMSRSQLHRKLTALMGRAPGALIRGMRLQRAQDLIRAGTHSLGRIAHQTGFSDQAHFTRSFKRQFGCTPSEFRDRGAEGP